MRVKTVIYPCFSCDTYVIGKPQQSQQPRTFPVLTWFYSNHTRNPLEIHSKDAQYTIKLHSWHHAKTRVTPDLARFTYSHWRVHQRVTQRVYQRVHQRVIQRVNPIRPNMIELRPTAVIGQARIWLTRRKPSASGDTGTARASARYQRRSLRSHRSTCYRQHNPVMRSRLTNR